MTQTSHTSEPVSPSPNGPSGKNPMTMVAELAPRETGDRRRAFGVLLRSLLSERNEDN